jgi:hypothetical protein
MLGNSPRVTLIYYTSPASWSQKDIVFPYMTPGVAVS